MWSFLLIFLHSRCGHLDVVKYLVNDAHCDPNIKKEDGEIPLHLACRLEVFCMCVCIAWLQVFPLDFLTG